jgi:hypothetical protein
MGKKAGIQYLERRMNTCPISAEKKQNEKVITETILHIYNFSSTQIICDIIKKHNNNERHCKQQ